MASKYLHTFVKTFGRGREVLKALETLLRGRSHGLNVFLGNPRFLWREVALFDNCRFENEI